MMRPPTSPRWLKALPTTTTTATNSRFLTHFSRPAMHPDPLEPLISPALTKREELSLDRHRSVAQHLSASEIAIDGRRLVNFCANDYLGLAQHRDIVAAMQRGAEQHGV